MCVCEYVCQASYEAVDFDVEEFRATVGCPGKLLHESKELLLQHRWYVYVRNVCVV